MKSDSYSLSDSDSGSTLATAAQPDLDRNNFQPGQGSIQSPPGRRITLRSEAVTYLKAIAIVALFTTWPFLAFLGHNIEEAGFTDQVQHLR